jgi:hypothetical protein
MPNNHIYTHEIKYLVFGKITRDFVIPHKGKPVNDLPGGSALYAAVGIAIWEKGIGIISQVGENYPLQELKALDQYGIDIEGIRVHPGNMDLREFHSPNPPGKTRNDSPAGYYSRHDQDYPIGLIGYDDTDKNKSALPFKNKQRLPLPDSYKEASAVHICALPLSTLTFWSSAIKKTSIKTTSIEPADDLIHKNQFHKLSSIIHGFTISIIKENQLRNLYMNPKADLWEMIENFASIGNEIVVINQGQMGQLVYDAIEKKRWHIPAYPARLINPTGIADAYCGGFLAGYYRNFDPLEAAVYGNISASMVTDGIGIIHPLKAMEGLSTARLNKVKGNIRRI